MASDAVSAPSAQHPPHHARDCSPARPSLPAELLLAQYDTGANKELGRGAHGVVYRATHKETGISYAMKTRRKADALPATLHYNRTEGEMLTRTLRHENVVQGIEYFETAESAVLVMELAQDGDLLELVNRRLGMPELEASLVALQLIAALQYSHALGIVHGDIKLENILILRANEEQKRRFGTEQRFALCDWGFAHKHTPGEVSERKVGSLRYQSPEMLTIRDCAPTADVWALGVVLYALVCASLPFEGKTPAEIADKIKKSKFTFPEKRGSAEFRSLVSSILQADPRARPSLAQIGEHAWFASARRLIQRLCAAPVSPPSSPHTSSRSNSGSLCVSASVSASASAASFAQPAAPHRQPSPATSRSPPASPPVLTPLAAKTPLSLPPTEICTSPPPPTSPINQRRPTPACWYMPDE